MTLARNSQAPAAVWLTSVDKSFNAHQHGDCKATSLHSIDQGLRTRTEHEANWPLIQRTSNTQPQTEA
jgi:hypothetical protein